MKKITRAATAIALTATALSATVLSAQSEVDTDGDGLLSYNELLAAHPAMTEELFVAIDRNDDGAVDAEELKLANEGGLLPIEG